MKVLPALAVIGLLAGACSRPAAEPDAASGEGDGDVLVRIDQGGYGLDDDKVAYAMGPDDLEGIGFEVLDADGAVALDGEVGPSTGMWSDAYPSVHPLDLTDLDEPGSYTVELDDERAEASPPLTVAPVDDLLAPMLSDAVRFFTAQRDGPEVDGSVLDRQPSHVLDQAATVYAAPTYEDEVLVGDELDAIGGPIDVSGGWFDAGDFLKITGTTAYATVALLLAERVAPDTPGLGAEADVGLAWLLRMWDAEEEVLYAQVGIGQGNDDVLTDHDVWRLPEDDDRNPAGPGDPEYLVGHRPVFPVNEPGEPISPNLAGRVAAAFALAAQRDAADDDPEAATRWLDRAAAVYERADTDPGPLRTAVPDDFYPEDSWADDLELAAAELAAAADGLDDPRRDGWIGEAEGWAADHIAADTGETLGVADVSAVAHSELVDLGAASTPELEDALRMTLDDAADLAADDPFGAGASTTEFDAAPTAFALVATAHLYERSVGDDAYRGFAAAQRGWVLGANAWGSSFVIGVGTTYPRCPEHQVANLADAGELVGAVVNGPNAEEILAEPNAFETMVPCDAPGADGRPFSDFDGRGAAYVDTVGSWQTSEPAIDFTATAVLAMALGTRADA